MQSVEAGVQFNCRYTHFRMTLGSFNCPDLNEDLLSRTGFQILSEYKDTNT